MRIELLYFDGCPNYEALLPKVREVAADEEVETQIELRRVESADQAQRERFLGSPTLRVDGEDVEPGAGHRTDFGLKCRLYRSDRGHFRDAAGAVDKRGDSRHAHAGPTPEAIEMNGGGAYARDVPG